MSDQQENKYPQKKILAVLNNPNDYLPKLVAEMIDAKCFEIGQLKGISEDQKKRVNRALLAIKEDEYYKKCKEIDATVEDCQFFINNYPESSRIEEIENRKTELELAQRRKEEEKNKERIEFEDLASKIDGQSLGYEEKKKLIAEFCRKNPFTSFSKELEDLKSKIEDQERARREWEEESKRNQEAENAWQRLLAQLASNLPIDQKRRALEEYGRKYSLHINEISVKRQEIDDSEAESEWQNVLLTLARDIAPEQKLAALNSYRSRYSKHAEEIPDKISEVERERNIMPEIRGVLGNSASKVNDFMSLITKYPAKKEFIREYY